MVFNTERRCQPASISSVFYETYDNLAELQNRLSEKNKIQCIVSNDLITNSIDLDKRNIPRWDYAE
jgi:hypothetical protein